MYNSIDKNKLGEFDTLKQRNAGVTCDGKIDVEDVTTLQKYLAGYDV